MYNRKNNTTVKLITILLIGVFTFNTCSYGLSIMPASQNPALKRDIYAALMKRNIIIADSKEDIAFLNANKAVCLLLSSGKYIVSPEIAKDEAKLLRSVIHEDIEAVMQIIRNKDASRYYAMKEYIMRDAVVERYKGLFRRNTPPPDLPFDLMFNDIVAKALEILITANMKMITEEELTPGEFRFIEVIAPLIKSAKHSYFTSEFWDPSERALTIQKAVNSGMVFYKVANSVNPERQAEKKDINPDIFKSNDIRAIADEDLTDENVEKIGKAYGTIIKRNVGVSPRSDGNPRVAVAMDARLTGPRIKEVFIKAVLSTGVDVVDIGLVPSPVLYFSVPHYDLDGAVMITASHNPKEWNGFKPMIGIASTSKGDIQALRKIAAFGSFNKGNGVLTEMSPVEDYIRMVVESVPDHENAPFKGKKIVVDSGNGAAQDIPRRIFEALGAEVFALFEEPDGRFPNRSPNPDMPEAADALNKAVLSENALLGFAYDGDSDRMKPFTKNGAVSGDYVLSILARAILKDDPAAKIVYDVKTSQIVKEDINTHGGYSYMVPTGHSAVKANMREMGASMGGEVSGHYYYRANHCFDDGIYASVQFLRSISESGKSVDDFIKDMPVYENTPEFRLNVRRSTKEEIVMEAKSLFLGYSKLIDIDGVIVTFPEEDGWFLIRTSGTENKVIIRAEAKTKEGLKVVMSHLVTYLERYPEIDIAQFNKYLYGEDNPITSRGLETVFKGLTIHAGYGYRYPLDMTIHENGYISLIIYGNLEFEDSCFNRYRTLVHTLYAWMRRQGYVLEVRRRPGAEHEFPWVVYDNSKELPQVSFTVPVKPDESYSVEMVRGIFDTDNKTLAKDLIEKKALFVIDKGIGKTAIDKIKKYIATNNIKASILVLEGGERVKEGFKSALDVIQQAEDFGIDRKEMMVLVGGGAILDMAGFAASILHRGVPHIRIPTTLLAQMDAGIGSKNAVNHMGQKNFLGVFQTPEAVYIDPEFLRTLDMRQMRAGLAEAVKVALIKNKPLFKMLEDHYQDVLDLDLTYTSHAKDIMWATVIAHLEQIDTDPYEKDLARPLDYGHEWGHRLEVVTHHRLNHGEAVAVGIAIDTVISYNRGYINENELDRTIKLLENIGLPTYDKDATLENIWPGLESFRRHLGGRLTITLLDHLGGKNDVHKITKKEVSEALRYLKADHEEKNQGKAERDTGKIDLAEVKNDIRTAELGDEVESVVDPLVEDYLEAAEIQRRELNDEPTYDWAFENKIIPVVKRKFIVNRERGLPTLVGVTGSAACGKTTINNEFQKRIKNETGEHVQVVLFDDWLLEPGDREIDPDTGKTTEDVFKKFEVYKFIKQMKLFDKGEDLLKPIYDQTARGRLKIGIDEDGTVIVYNGANLTARVTRDQKDSPVILSVANNKGDIIDSGRSVTMGETEVSVGLSKEGNIEVTILDTKYLISPFREGKRRLNVINNDMLVKSTLDPETGSVLASAEAVLTAAGGHIDESGQLIEKPWEAKEYISAEPGIYLVEGILALYDTYEKKDTEKLHNIYDAKIFIDADFDVRLARGMLRFSNRTAAMRGALPSDEEVNEYVRKFMARKRLEDTKIYPTADYKNVNRVTSQTRAEAIFMLFKEGRLTASENLSVLRELGIKPYALELRLRDMGTEFVNQYLLTYKNGSISGEKHIKGSGFEVFFINGGLVLKAPRDVSEFKNDIMPFYESVLRPRAGGMLAPGIIVDISDLNIAGDINGTETKLSRVLIQNQGESLRDRLDFLIKNKRIDEAKKLIKKFCDLQLKMWKAGIIDTDPDILDKYGIIIEDGRENVVAFAVDSLTNDPKLYSRDAYLEAGKVLPDGLGSYYKKVMAGVAAEDIRFMSAHFEQGLNDVKPLPDISHIGVDNKRLEHIVRLVAYAKTKQLKRFFSLNKNTRVPPVLVWTKLYIEAVLSPSSPLNKPIYDAVSDLYEHLLDNPYLIENYTQREILAWLKNRHPAVTDGSLTYVKCYLNELYAIFEKSLKKGHPAYAFSHIPEGEFTLSDYCLGNGVSRSTARRDFNILEELELVNIQRRGEGSANIISSIVPSMLVPDVSRILSLYQTKNDIPDIRENLKEKLYAVRSSSVLLTDIIPAYPQVDRVYEIKYDASRLRPSQIDIINEYAGILSKRISADVRIKPVSSNRGSYETLIAVYCFGKDFKGEGHVDVFLPEGDEEHEYLLKITGMLNLAVAASNISKDATKEEMRSTYGPLVGFIKHQYKILMGSDIKLPSDPSKLLKALRTIVLVLPKIYKIPADQIEMYNKLAKQALLSA